MEGGGGERKKKENILKGKLRDTYQYTWPKEGTGAEDSSGPGRGNKMARLLTPSHTTVAILSNPHIERAIDEEALIDHDLLLWLGVTAFSS